MARRTFRWRAGWSALCVAVWVAWSSPRVACADELSDFGRGRAAYDAQRYEDARARFEALVGGETPSITTRALVLEARKYLGATYLFLHRAADAERQFAWLLQDDPAYPLDPVDFPTDVVALFGSVRDRLARAAEEHAIAQREQEERLQRAQQAELERQRARLDTLRRLAVDQEVVHENSRFVAAIPFGVGQFQNGDATAGAALAITESALLAANLACVGVYLALPRPDTGVPADPSRADFSENARIAQGLRIGSWISFGALLATAIGGIVEAQISFVPTRSTHVARPLPPELVEDFDLAVGPDGVVISGHFRNP